MKTKILTLACLFLGMMIHSKAQAQLNGTYTINSNVSTGGTNFASFGDFSSALGSGVSGPVTVNVASGSGPYLENVTFNAVSGASNTFRITINGNGEEIVNTSTTTGYVVNLNGADFFTFNDLVLETRSTETSARCFWFHNNADNNEIKDCELIISRFNPPSYYSLTAYIVFNSSESGYSGGSHGRNNLIEGNKMWNGGDTIAGPVFGISDYAHTGLDNTIIRDNEIRDVYYIYIEYGNATGLQVVGNRFHTNHPNSSRLRGFVLRSIDPDTAAIQCRIDSNEFTNMGGNELYVGQLYGSTGTSQKPISISGNAIRNLQPTTSRGMYIRDSKYVDIVGNEAEKCTTTSSNINLICITIQCDHINVYENKAHDNYGGNWFSSTIQSFRSSNVHFRGNEIVDNEAAVISSSAIRIDETSQFTLEANKIADNSANGGTIFVLNSDTGEVINNLDYNNTGDGPYSSMFFTNNSYVKVNHNTVHWIVRGKFGTCFGIYNWDSLPGNTIQNNIIYCDSAQSEDIRPIYSSTASKMIKWGGNVIYEGTGTGDVIYVADQTFYYNLSDWKNAVNDSTSVVADPEFSDLENGDLTPTNEDIDNSAISGLVLTDFYDVTRSATPDPGAIEFNASNCGSYITLSSAPDSSSVVGSMNTKADVNQMFIAYGPQSMIIRCSGASGDSTSFTFSGSYLSAGPTDSSATFSPEDDGVFTIVCVAYVDGCYDTAEIDICVIDATGDHPNDKNYKVKLCHQPDDSSSSPQTISISINAVQQHLTEHNGCRLGGCSSSCSSNPDLVITDPFIDGLEQHDHYEQSLSEMIIDVHPNPSTSTFEVGLMSESDMTVSVVVTDLMGHVLIRRDDLPSNSSIELGENLAQGMYLLQVRHGEEVQTFRILKQ